MQARDVLRHAIEAGNMLCQQYLADLNDSELLVRPVPGANHIAWQLGHLIASEHGLMESIRPGSMPPLPEGFAQRYTKETAAHDDPGSFHTKNELLSVLETQRAGTLRLLAEFPEEEFDHPAPEPIRSYCPTVADVFLLQGTHYIMHSGQWAIVRRKLGRPPLF